MATAAGRARQQKGSSSGPGGAGAAGGGGTRKIKIKPFKRPPSLPPDFYDRTSSVLLEATRAILRHEPLYAHGDDNRSAVAAAASPPAVVAATGAVAPQAAGPPPPSRSPTSAMLNPDGHMTIVSGAKNSSAATATAPTARRPIGREELYRSVEDLCVHRYGARLYEAVVRAVDEGAFESMERLCDTAGAVRVVNGASTQIAFSSLPSSDGAAPLLSAVRAVYADYSDYMFFVRSIFLYLDRSYVLHSGCAATKSLWEVGIDSFRRQMTMQSRSPGADGASSAAVASSSGPSGPDAMLVDGATRGGGGGGGGGAVSVSDAVVCGILHLVRRERDGEAVDRALLRSLLRMTAELDLYASAFLPAFLEASASYYGAEGERVLTGDAGGDVPTFLRHVEARLGQCREACVAYLDCYDSFSHPSASASKEGANGSGSEKFHGTRKALLTVVENHLLKPHADVVLQPKNCHALFGDPHRVVPDVKRMYVLLNRIGYSPQLKAAFYQFARHVGLEIIHEKGAGAGSAAVGGAAAGPVPKILVSATVTTSASSSASASSERDVVPKLLRLKRHLSDVHVRAFDSDEMFHGAIRDALEHVLNSRGSKPSELLARHVDALLKSTRKDKTADGGDAEGALDEVMVLFRHLHSKDVFEAFYQKDLARRLLHGKSSSVDMERSFLSKLKAECGSGYTSKMEGMFKDIELSRDIMAQYSEYVRDKVSPASAGLNGTSRVDMDVQILTTGYWPQYPQHKSIKLPDELQVHIQRFEHYYDNKYQGRRIHWQYSLCNINLKANFAEKRMELLVNLYQALVLLCFNDSDGLTLPQVRERTGIDDRSELERVLQSLSMGKPGTRVLIKVDAPPPGGGANPKPKKSVADTDVFRYNAKFTNKLNRIKIPQIQARETVHHEQTKVHEAVARDRQYLIDAAIVRIMKARKTIQHRDLMGEVMNQIKTVSRPVSSEIKKRIEGLMEREYLERDEADKTVYNYLA